MPMVKKGLAKIIRPVNISYHLKECQMAQALGKNTVFSADKFSVIEYRFSVCL